MIYFSFSSFTIFLSASQSLLSIFLSHPHYFNILVTHIRVLLKADYNCSSCEPNILPYGVITSLQCNSRPLGTWNSHKAHPFIYLQTRDAREVKPAGIFSCKQNVTNSQVHSTHFNAQNIYSDIHTCHTPNYNGSAAGTEMAFNTVHQYLVAEHWC